MPYKIASNINLASTTVGKIIKEKEQILVEVKKTRPINWFAIDMAWFLKCNTANNMMRDSGNGRDTKLQ